MTGWEYLGDGKIEGLVTLLARGRRSRSQGFLTYSLRVRIDLAFGLLL
ncbi:MAG: hypothetical protein J7647_05850 [Cyanobacteria bacterium SBLK]|nr:hypothetical protein [Cyanobacteria bacterium SBLK]